MKDGWIEHGNQGKDGSTVKELVLGSTIWHMQAEVPKKKKWSSEIRKLQVGSDWENLMLASFRLRIKKLFQLCGKQIPHWEENPSGKK